MRPGTSRLAVALAVLAASVLIPSAARAAVLTFEDLPPLGAFEGVVPDGYGGLNWDGMGYLNSLLYDGNPSGYQGGTVSPNHVAFNEFALVATVDGSVFDFNSAYLAAAWNNDLSVTVKGFLLGTEIYSMTVDGLSYSTTPGASAMLVNFNFLGIDMLTFESFGGVDADSEDGGSGQHFVMDNVTINSVPEPGSLILLGTGLLGLVAGMRKRVR